MLEALKKVTDTAKEFVNAHPDDANVDQLKAKIALADQILAKPIRKIDYLQNLIDGLNAMIFKEDPTPANPDPTPQLTPKPTPVKPIRPQPQPESEPRPAEEEDHPSVVFERVSGQDRWKTAVAVSEQSFDHADTVIVVSGRKFTDALSAGPLALVHHASILLVDQNQVDEAVKNEIERLGAKNIILVGGESSISTRIEKAFIGDGQNVKRIAGKDRYEISAMIATEMKKNVNTEAALIASGAQFADALSASAVAMKENMPILLLQKEKLSPAVASLIATENQVVLLGGEASIGTAVEKELQNQGHHVTRIPGKIDMIPQNK